MIGLVYSFKFLLKQEFRLCLICAFALKWRLCLFAHYYLRKLFKLFLLAFIKKQKKIIKKISRDVNGNATTGLREITDHNQGGKKGEKLEKI